MMPSKVTVLHGSDRDGKEIRTSRNGHLASRAAEIDLWRYGWISARMQHNIHETNASGMSRLKIEGPWVVLDLTNVPTLEERRKMKTKARFT